MIAVVTVLTAFALGFSMRTRLAARRRASRTPRADLVAAG